MKRFLYLLFALPLLALITSCDDDEKNLPNVSVSVDYSGATYADGTFTVKQGEEFAITALKVIPAEGTKEATLGRTIYFIDGFPIYETIVSPFGVKIDTGTLEIGKHLLQVRTTIFQVDKEVATGLFTYTLDVIENDNPENPDNPGEGGDDNGGTVTPDLAITENE